MGRKWIDGKTVIISGVSGGLGLNIAKLLIEKHSCRVLGICRNKEKMEKAIAENKFPSDKFSYKLFDVSVKENWDNFRVELQNECIVPDILINNAGFMLPFMKFELIPDSEIEKIVKTDFLSVTYSIKALLPLLKQSKTPAILNISSAAGVLPIVGESMYCAVKYAVKGFTETLWQEYKNSFYYIGGAYPGFIRTNILDKAKVSDKERQKITKFMTPVEKATKTIVKGISKRKKRIITGFGGQYINKCGKTFPRLTANTVTKILKSSKMELFNDVFE